jgi:hypothetical protein
MRPFLRIAYTDDRSVLSFILRGWNQPLLVLGYVAERSDAQRALFFVRGGVLRKKGSNPASRLEFRICTRQNAVLAAVLDFHPALPWPVYIVTQSIAHRIVMWRYSARLKKISKRT